MHGFIDEPSRPRVGSGFLDDARNGDSCQEVSLNVAALRDFGWRRWLRGKEVAERLDDTGRGHAPLPATVAVSDRDGAVGQGLAIDRDAERRARLILAAVAAADRAFFVVKHVVL